MTKKMFVVKRHHLENSKLARQGKKPTNIVHKFKETEFEIFQNEAGEWMLRFGKSKNVFPATDVEVALWLRLKELEEQK